MTFTSIPGGAHAAPDGSAEQQPVEFLAKVRNFRPIGVNGRPEEDAAMQVIDPLDEAM